MKQIFKAIVFMAFLYTGSESNTLNAKSLELAFSHSVYTGGDSTIVLTVSDMGCKTDSKMVETALYRKAGVKKVSIKDDTVSIVYNPAKVSKEELIKIIENTGTCEDPNAKVHKVKVKTF